MLVRVRWRDTVPGGSWMVDDLWHGQTRAVPWHPSGSVVRSGLFAGVAWRREGEGGPDEIDK